MAQTTIQNDDAIRYGSAKLEIGASLAALTNVGAIRGLTFEHRGENIEIEFDNTDPIKFFKQGTRASIMFTLYETDMSIIDLTDDGLVNVTSTAATPVSNAAQTIASGNWSYNQWTELTYQHYSGGVIAAPTVTVEAGVDNTLVEDTDFFIGLNAAGDKYGIVFVDSTTITTEGQDMVLEIDYTPRASQTMTFNATGKKTTKYARITNTASDGTTYIITMNDVTNIKPLSMPFPSDDSDDPILGIEMELQGLITSIVDTQAV